MATIVPAVFIAAATLAAHNLDLFILSKPPFVYLPVD